MKYTTTTPYIASFVIVRKGNKIAFVLREHTKWMNGYYGLPSGKVENDESYLQAAVREAREEIGIEIKLRDLKYLHTSHRREGLYWVDVYFEAMKWKGEPCNNEPNKHSEFAWLDMDDLPENVITSVRFVLEQIKRGKVYSEYGWEEK